MHVFGRTKTPQPQTPAEVETAKTGGKGRPTPSRREAEARNRRPLGAPPMRAGASKEERKAAKAAQRAAASAARAKSREALVTGDERYLPARDKGPARRFARDYVDARRNVGEYLLPSALVILLVGILPLGQMQAISAVLLYVLMIATIIDAVIVRTRAQKQATARFGDKARGVGGYAMMRSLQMRRTRLPRPQVKRGEYPT